MVTRGYAMEFPALAQRSLCAHAILWTIIKCMGKTNSLVISQKALGEMTGYGRTTLYKATKLLEEERWMQVTKTGTSNCYTVNSHVVWRDKSEKRFASFYAAVVISETEQKKRVATFADKELRLLPILGRQAA